MINDWLSSNPISQQGLTIEGFNQDLNSKVTTLSVRISDSLRVTLTYILSLSLSLTLSLSLSAEY